MHAVAEPGSPDIEVPVSPYQWPASRRQCFTAAVHGHLLRADFNAHTDPPCCTLLPTQEALGALALKCLSARINGLRPADIVSLLHCLATFCVAPGDELLSKLLARMQSQVSHAEADLACTLSSHLKVRVCLSVV